jgi:hypothetical protein
MTDFTIGEYTGTCIEIYKPKMDCDNQRYRDLNRNELSEEYKERTFMCCGTTFTHKKKPNFLNSHIKTAKHKKSLDIATQKHKDEYGTFTNAADLVDRLIKQNRDLKVQLHRKSDDFQEQSKEMIKKDIIIDALREENVVLKNKEVKRSKKFKVVLPLNLIDL